ncbi:MAG TPA: ABC transporter ATP-binding protein [Syntrophales bacterium]|nr:ABC transporter ATP-binding protein [Syntrophales bacterium]
MLNVENIRLGYSNIPVIHDVSFRVGKGEIVSLIGGNGNGKSTILKGLSGILHPSHGKIVFNEKDITNTPAHRIVALGMSHVPEGRRLFPSLSVYKNLLLGAYLTDDKKIIAGRLEYVYSIFPILKDRGQQKASTLSGGEQQMVAIGRGLMSRPQFLMLDEPSWGIAPKLVEKIFEVIQEIRKDGVTILLVEQDVQEALDISDRGYVIQTGKVVLEGTGKELLSSELIQKSFLGL